MEMQLPSAAQSLVARIAHAFVSMALNTLPVLTHAPVESPVSAAPVRSGDQKAGADLPDEESLGAMLNWSF